MQIARCRFRVEDNQVFDEGACLRGDSAVGQDDDAAAIEDQAVIAADLIDIDDGQADATLPENAACPTRRERLSIV